MSNDNKLKLLQYLAFFPTIVCMMLLVDINAYPYAKLLASIIAALLQLLCLLLFGI
ncbi:putative membrane protein [Bacillus cereus]|nr:putative membrane protein [Bacillus cereus]AJI05219.1 putative membrane protein [Bacillus cereus G9241]